MNEEDEGRDSGSRCPGNGGGRRKRSKHKLAVEVGENVWRIILPRKSTVGDLVQAVQERLRKKQKTGLDATSIVTEIREKCETTPRNNHGHSGGGSTSGTSATASTSTSMFLQLDEDDALSDVVDSDAEGCHLVAMLEEEEEEAAAAPTIVTKPVLADAGSAEGSKSETFDDASTAKQTATGVEDSTEDENNGADEEDTGAPHKISYTVAGMPRVVDGDASDFDRRGPREGTVTAFAGWTLRDLKGAIGKAENVSLTPDVASLPAPEQAAITVKVTLMPNITVPISLDRRDTVGDLWRMIARAAACAKDLLSSQPSLPSSSLDEAAVTEPIATAAAEAATAARSATGVQVGEDFGMISLDRCGGDAGGDDGRHPPGIDTTKRRGVLPPCEALLGEGLMVVRQAEREEGTVPAARPSFDGEMVSTGFGSKRFLDFADDVIGDDGCDLEDGEELSLVGHGAVPAASLPVWTVRVLVLGQPLGCLQISNPNTGGTANSLSPSTPADETAAPAAATSAGASAGADTDIDTDTDTDKVEDKHREMEGIKPSSASSTAPTLASSELASGSGSPAVVQDLQELHTIGQLRTRLGAELSLPVDRVEMWIVPHLPQEANGRNNCKTRESAVSPSSSTSSYRTTDSSGVRAGEDMDAEANLRGGVELKHPPGFEAVLDDMSLDHYGIGHLTVVDVRVREKPAPSESGNMDGDGSLSGHVDEGVSAEERTSSGKAVEGGGVGETPPEKDILRVEVVTNRRMCRGEQGVDMFVSKSTFNVKLTKRLAARLLRVSPASITRLDMGKPHCASFYSTPATCLSKYGDEVHQGSRMVAHINPAHEKSCRASTHASGTSASGKDEKHAAPSTRTTVSLWVEEATGKENEDPLGIASGPLSLSATVYPLHSTSESDQLDLQIWGLLRAGIRVYALFYKTSSPLSACEATGAGYQIGRQEGFGMGPCWSSRPVPRTAITIGVDTTKVGMKESTNAKTNNNGSGKESVSGSAASGEVSAAREESRGLDSAAGGETGAEDDTEAGQSCFLSCLYMLCDNLDDIRGDIPNSYNDDNGDQDGGDGMGWLMREVMTLLNPRFPPAALALERMSNNCTTPAERACIVQCLWGLMRAIVPVDVANQSVLEHSRAFIGWLVSRSAASRETAQKEFSVRKLDAAATAPPAPTVGGQWNKAAAAAHAPESQPQSEVKFENISLVGVRLAERLEARYAVRIKAGGELLKNCYSIGGAMEKRDELLSDLSTSGWGKVGQKGSGAGADAAESMTIEFVPWQAVDRLLLASPLRTQLPVLRFNHPKGGSNPSLTAATMSGDATSSGAAEEGGDDSTSWMSLVDWSTCVHCASAYSWLRVIAPLSVGNTMPPSLTRDRRGHMCFFTGKSKSTEQNLILFTPLDGGKISNEDAHVLAQALDKLGKSGKGLPGEDFEEAGVSTRIAREVVVVCLDSSYSMGERPGFEDDEQSDDENEKSIELDFDWSERASIDVSGDGMDVIDITSDGEDDVSEVEAEAAADSGGHPKAFWCGLKKVEMDDLRCHACLPQLREVARILHERFGAWTAANANRLPCAEMVLEELILEKFDADCPDSVARTKTRMAVYRRYRKELLEILLEKDETSEEVSKHDGDLAQWAPRQFICPITQGLMMDPVVAVDGHSYERHAILEWYSACSRNMRSATSPMTGFEIDNEDVTSNHALKSRIQDWVIDTNRDHDKEDGAASAGAASHGKHAKIEVRDGDKSYSITVDRFSGKRGLTRLQVLVAQRKAMSVVDLGKSDSSTTSSKRSSGKKKSSSSASRRQSSSTPREVSAMVSPGTIRLTKDGFELRSLTHLKNGDVLKVVHVEENPSQSATVQLRVHWGGEVFLLIRRGETNFSIKLRLWAHKMSNALNGRDYRPSRIRLWHGLESAGDGCLLGMIQYNNICPPWPKERSGGVRASASVRPVVGGDGKNERGVCLLDVHSHNPFRCSGSDRPSLTRLDAVKQLFHAFINRTQAYDLPVEVGLVSFGSEVDVDCEPTPVLENFRDQVDSLDNSGDTRLWDALQMACTLLEKWKTDWLKKAKKRKADARRRLDGGNATGKGDKSQIKGHTPAVRKGRRKKSRKNKRSNSNTNQDDKGIDKDIDKDNKDVDENNGEDHGKGDEKGRHESGETAVEQTQEEEPVLRIVVLSDGDDTKSDARAHTVCGRLQKAGVLVDSVTVGTEMNERLKCLSIATGGYAFHPTTMRAAMRLNELETVLSARQRVPREEKHEDQEDQEQMKEAGGGHGAGASARGKKRSPQGLTKQVSTDQQLLNRDRRNVAHDTEETTALKMDPRTKSTCRPLEMALATLGPADSIANASSGSGNNHGGNAHGGLNGNDAGETVHPERARRVQREMMDMMRNPHEAFEVFPSDGDMCFWKALLKGPESTPYEGGCWMLTIGFPPKYPAVAPSIWFVTPIRHCNINAHGRVCHAILDRSWMPNTSVSTIFACVYGLLLYPDHDDPLDSTLTFQMYDTDGQYQAAIVEHVQKHASKPREIWAVELEAEGISPQERLASALVTIAQADVARKADRLDEAKLKAWQAAIYAAGGPAPISAAQDRPQRSIEDVKISSGLKAARAAACMVVAWAVLAEAEPDFAKATAIVGNARIHDSSSPDINLCLAKIAEARCNKRTSGAPMMVKYLKEAVKYQKLHLRMTTVRTAARTDAKSKLDALQAELDRVAPSHGPKVMVGGWWS